MGTFQVNFGKTNGLDFFLLLAITTECMIRAGLREQTCRHSTEGRTGDKATTPDAALHV